MAWGGKERPRVRVSLLIYNADHKSSKTTKTAKVPRNLHFPSGIRLYIARCTKVRVLLRLIKLASHTKDFRREFRIEFFSRLARCSKINPTVDIPGAAPASRYDGGNVDDEV
ncbi:uncharacterized protein LOC143902396 isoform X1 [Temnothorax americanus]|uniref:uncharacterized protein LOC143902396 isoform X1 n=1 Tax=Temnothorax americanus TaxID=1964332 RepID=UPI004069534F